MSSPRLKSIASTEKRNIPVLSVTSVCSSMIYLTLTDKFLGSGGYLWSSCPQCGKKICNACLYNKNNPSPECCDATREPDEPRWQLGCKAETRTTYLFPHLKRSSPSPTPPKITNYPQNESPASPSNASSSSYTEQPMGFRRRLLVKAFRSLLKD
jgi:hypothetical protein